MGNSIRPFFFIISFVLISCSAGKRVELGRTQIEELKRIEGEPLEVSQTRDKKDLIYRYPKDLKYQIRNKTVIGKFRAPQSEEEKYLVYWQNKLKGCQKTKIEHKSLEVEIRCEQEGVSVFYFEGNSLISRIVEYEKK